MRFCELKIETLRLLFADAEGVPLSEESLETAENDEQYAQYLRMIPGAVNRAFSYLEMRGILPKKTAVFNETGDAVTHIFEAELPKDCYRITDVHYLDGLGVSYPCRHWQKDADGISVAASRLFARISVSYLPSLPRIGEDTGDGWTLPLPEALAGMLPYYLKSELFLSDEPDEAALARKQFDEFLSEYEATDTCSTGMLRESFITGYWS